MYAQLSRFSAPPTFSRHRMARAEGAEAREWVQQPCKKIPLCEAQIKTQSYLQQDCVLRRLAERLPASASNSTECPKFTPDTMLTPRRHKSTPKRLCGCNIRDQRKLKGLRWKGVGTILSSYSQGHSRVRCWFAGLLADHTGLLADSHLMSAPDSKGSANSVCVPSVPAHRR